MAWALLCACAATRGAAAVQSVTAAGFLSLAEHRVDAGYGVERSSGALVGGAATLHIGHRSELSLRAVGGTLTSSTSSAIDRDVGEIAVEARWLASSWLALDVGAARRVYSTDLARQVWSSGGAGVEAILPLVESRLNGVLHVSLRPVVSVSGTQGPDLGAMASAGIEYRRARVGMRALYSVERYDFPARAGVERLEQVSALTLQVEISRAIPRR